jgi:hypothetical protein
MKDALYVVCAAVGLLLVGTGIAGIQRSDRAATRGARASGHIESDRQIYEMLAAARRARASDYFPTDCRWKVPPDASFTVAYIGPKEGGGQRLVTLSPDSPFAVAHRATTAGMAWPSTVLHLLFGYLLQIVGCALYAENRGRSPLFGLLGLLSPIGYVFLSLLNPVPRTSE